MWRFKPSKYKNAAPKVPPKKDWITDISACSQQSSGNHIQSSAAFIAFNIEAGGGGSLGVANLNGSERNTRSQLNAHSDLITDFQFCPYDDGLLATGSQDHHVKLWRIPYGSNIIEIPPNPIVNMYLEDGVETLKFNPIADCILTTAANQKIQLFDISTQKEIYATCHDDVVQGLSWKGNGHLLASCGRDKKLRVTDPRNPGNTQVTTSHSNNRDARVLWLGDSDHILTTGFGAGREREVFVRDIKMLNEPVFTYSGESSLGVLIPLYDADTNMLFLVAKADTAVAFWEVTDKSPLLQEVCVYMGSVQTKGAALVPKRGLKIMEGEVNRLLLLGSDCIAPIPYIVPRKSYREFHHDLFPDSPAPEPTMTASEWSANKSAKTGTISLNPSSKGNKSLLKFNHKLGGGPQENQSTPIVQITKSEKPMPDILILGDVKQNVEVNKTSEALSKPPIAPKPASPATVQRSVRNLSFKEETKPKAVANDDSKKFRQRPTTSFGIRVSKFRHLDGLLLPNETNITDVSSLTRTIPGESDGFQVNDKLLALPLGTSGGFIALMKACTQCRAPTLADAPGVLCGTKCLDFTWDPFDSYRLVTACDNGDVQIWNIAQEHLNEKVSEPSSVFQALSDKVSIVRFHPGAKNILCTAGSDLVVRIWDLSSNELMYSLEGHKDQILSLAWSPDGKFVATVCKDLKVRVYDPRSNCQPIKEGQGPEGIRGARIVWVLDGSHIVVSGFNKVSERQIYLYNFEDISNPLGNVGLDVSPATLIPYYDEDSSTLFLTGKGDSTIYAFEVATDAPYFHALSHYKCSGPHQALSFLSKHVCNVRNVEFARCIRLTTTLIETLSFRIPRLRMEYFQNDIFPDTAVTWEPTMTSEEWLSGMNKLPEHISLKPDDMTLLSQAPAPIKNKPSQKPDTVSSVPIVFEGEIVLEGSLAFMQGNKEKEEQIVQAMMSQCQYQQNSLPQDSFDGVDPEEWEENECSEQSR